MTIARDNPFASHRVEALKYRFPGFSLDQNLNRLEQFGWRGALVGPQGSGKTTLLIELRSLLQQRLAGQRSVQLWFVPRASVQQRQEWHKLIQSIDPKQILLVDGIERLDWFVRGQLLGWLPQGVGTSRRITRSVIATTHRRMLRLPIWLRCSTTPTILNELLFELYPTAPQSLVEEAEMLFRKRRGNIREVWWKLYDHVANQ